VLLPWVGRGRSTNDILLGLSEDFVPSSYVKGGEGEA